MKIERARLNNFMLFQNVDITFSQDINIICGENSIGKTAILKVLYSILKAVKESKNGKTEKSKEQTKEILVEKLLGVFRPDNNKVGRLVGRKQGSNRAEIEIDFADDLGAIHIEFSTRHEKHIDADITKLGGILEEVVYIPPKEIISSTENFTSLYEQYHIAFEETYYDLAKLLSKPLTKGAYTKEQRVVLDKFESLLDGSVTQKNNKFYLKQGGAGEFEMGLLSEGYRKMATLMYLITSGSLGKNSILFWDEPETNMNPLMIKPICDALIELSKMGVQVFLTTHDYFVQQYFNMISSYPKASKNKLNINFISFYRDSEDNNEVKFESANRISELNYNSIMDEFDQLYDREQGMFYGNC